LRVNTKLTRAQASLDEYAKSYQAYSKLERRNLTDVTGKEAVRSWVDDRRVKLKITQTNEESLQRLIGKLSELNESTNNEDTSSVQMEERTEVSGEQVHPAPASDAADQTPPQTQERREKIEAFRQRRRRFKRGWLSERIDNVRSAMEGIRHRFEEKNTLEVANQQPLLITMGEDVEMHDPSQSGQQRPSSTPKESTEDRYLVLRDRLRYIHEQMDLADTWATSEMDEEFITKFKQSVDNIVQKFLEEEATGQANPVDEPEQSVMSADKDPPLKSVLDAHKDIGDIKRVSEAFLRIGERAPVFDSGIQVQIEQVCLF
jgi:hypothetical protein